MQSTRLGSRAWLSKALLSQSPTASAVLIVGTVVLPPARITLFRMLTFKSLRIGSLTVRSTPRTFSSGQLELLRRARIARKQLTNSSSHLQALSNPTPTVKTQLGGMRPLCGLEQTNPGGCRVPQRLPNNASGMMVVSTFDSYLRSSSVETSRSTASAPLKPHSAPTTGRYTTSVCAVSFSRIVATKQVSLAEAERRFCGSVCTELRPRSSRWASHRTLWVRNTSLLCVRLAPPTHEAMTRAIRDQQARQAEGSVTAPIPVSLRYTIINPTCH